MGIQRINRMVLGVAAPVAAFIEGLAGRTPDDLDDGAAIDPAASLLVIGRQQLLADGSGTRLGGEVIDTFLEQMPKVVIYVLPDRMNPTRYAKDAAAWARLAARGTRVMILEVAVMRELGDGALKAARPVFNDTTAGVFSLFDGTPITLPT